MMRDLQLGLAYFIAGAKLIWQPGIRAYAFIPIVLNLILLTALLAVGFHYIDVTIDYYLNFLPSWLQWLEWLVSMMVISSLLLISLSCFNLIANIVTAPFNSLLAARVCQHFGIQASEHSKPLIKTSLQACCRQIQFSCYYLTRACGLLLLGFIPGLQLFMPFLWFIFNAWMFYLQYSDYAFDNADINFAQMRLQLGKRRLLGYGFGCGVLVSLFFPLFNALVIPAAVCGASQLWVEQYTLGQIK